MLFVFGSSVSEEKNTCHPLYTLWSFPAHHENTHTLKEVED
jgi:hypothetical protein